MVVRTTALVVFTVCTAAAENWPQFRGPGGAGNAAAAAKPPVEFGPSKNLLWSVDLADGQGSPAIWGDRVFITQFVKAEKKLELLSIDAQTGKVLWRQPIVPKDVERTHPLSSPAATSPVTDGERVYVYYGSYGVAAYDFDGKMLWENQLSLARAVFGNPNSPVLAGDLVIVTRDYLPDPVLIAYHKLTGKLAWQLALAKPTVGGPMTAHATPVVWNDQLVLHRPGELAGHSLKDGSRIWWTPLGSQGAAPPTAHGGTVYVNGYSLLEAGTKPELPSFEAVVKQADKDGDGLLSRNELPGDLYLVKRPDTPEDIPNAHITLKDFFFFIDLNRDGKLDASEWAATRASSPNINGLYAVVPGKVQGQLEPSAILWKDGRNVPEVPAPIAYRDRVCNITNGGILSCFEAQTGKVIHRGRIGTPGAYFSSPVYADGKLYVASTDGVVSVLDATTYEVLAKNDLGEGVFATPAPVGKRLFVRTSAHLYAFENR
jgi:outer membrane protein assembly factor BamB